MAGLQQQLSDMQAAVQAVEVGQLQQMGLVGEDGRVDKAAGLAVASKLEGLLNGETMGGGRGQDGVGWDVAGMELFGCVW
jgi:hypothetical protein